MCKEDMLIAIKIYDAVEGINGALMEIVGDTGLYSSKFKDVFLIADLIYRNSSVYESESDDSFQKFLKIIQNKKLSPEERCGQLMRDAGLAEEICETVSRAARMHDEPEPGTDQLTIEKLFEGYEGNYAPIEMEGW